MNYALENNITVTLHIEPPPPIFPVSQPLLIEIRNGQSEV